jgi:hypothetical protein
MWTTEQDAANGIVWEVNAVSHTKVEVTPWAASAPVDVGTVVRCGEEDMPWGTGVPDGQPGRLDIDDFVNMIGTTGAKHVLMSPDFHNTINGRAVNEAYIMSIKDAAIYAIGVPDRDGGQPWEEGATIYTDGSYSVRGTLMERATGDERRLGYAGIYVDGVQQRRYRIVGGVEHESAYTTELLALTIAKRLARRHVIFTDSQAAIDTVQRYENGKVGKAVGNMLGAATEGVAKIVKIRAHIERHEQDEAKWSTEARGNYRADRTADGDSEEAGGAITDMEDENVIRHLTNGMEFIWRTQGNVVYEIGKSADMNGLRQYLAARDVYRAQRGASARWAGTSAGLAASMCESRDDRWVRGRGLCASYGTSMQPVRICSSGGRRTKCQRVRYAGALQDKST